MDKVYDNDNALVGLCFLPKKLPRVLTPLLRSQAAAAGLRLVALDPRTGPDLDLQPQPLRDGTAADAPAPTVAPGSVAVGQAEEVAPAGVAAEDSAVAGSGAAGAGDTARLQPPLGLATPRMPLDVIVHKLHRDEAWETSLAAYAAAHPATVILDPPPAIHATEDRAMMLAAAGLTLRVPLLAHAPSTSGQQVTHPVCSGRDAGGEAGSGQQEGRLEEAGGEQSGEVGQQDADVVEVRVEAPPQVVVQTREELRRLVEEGCRSSSSNDSASAVAGLRLPLLLKTRRTDAAGGSGHGVAVVRSWAELEEQAAALQPPAPTPTPTPSGSSPVQAAAPGAAAGAVPGAVAPVLAPAAEAAAFEPLVVQQYVPHTQALYKVYVLGRHVRVERRATLTAGQVAAAQGELAAALQDGRRYGVAAAAAGSHGMPSVIHRISTAPLARATTGATASAGASAAHAAAEEDAVGNAPAAAASGGADACAPVMDEAVDEVVMAAVARALSRQLNLTMFNFDLILPVDQSLASGADVAEAGEAGASEAGGRAAKRQRPAQEQEPQQGRTPRRLRLCVVDVNYFPGYDKLEGWEEMLVEHLRAAADRAVAARRAAACAAVG